jgi:monovalent cation/hydrogen antiporter
LDLLMTVLLLIVGLLISNIISHYIPSIPTASTQIGFGIFIALLLKYTVMYKWCLSPLVDTVYEW